MIAKLAKKPTSLPGIGSKTQKGEHALSVENKRLGCSNPSVYEGHQIKMRSFPRSISIVMFEKTGPIPLSRCPTPHLTSRPKHDNLQKHATCHSRPGSQSGRSTRPLRRSQPSGVTCWSRRWRTYGSCAPDGREQWRKQSGRPNYDASAAATVQGLLLIQAGLASRPAALAARVPLLQHFPHFSPVFVVKGMADHAGSGGFAEPLRLHPSVEVPLHLVDFVVEAGAALPSGQVDVGAGAAIVAMIPVLVEKAPLVPFAKPNEMGTVYLLWILQFEEPFGVFPVILAYISSAVCRSGIPDSGRKVLKGLRRSRSVSTAWAENLETR